LKKRLSICLEEDLIEKINYIRDKKYKGLASLSSLIEYYLRSAVEEEFQRIKDEEARKPRVIT